MSMRLNIRTHLPHPILAFAILLSASGQTIDATSRKDVVVMNNGDRFTGEVKSLRNGVLYVKTDYVDQNIGLDWAQVQTVESSVVYQVTLINGIRVTGKIKRISPEAVKGKDFVVESPAGGVQVGAAQVAEISTQKATVWRQLTGSI